MRFKIQHGELKPGSRIPELKLCKEFEISRTPLREALKVLAAEGLVIIQPHKGSLVAPIDEKEVRDSFEVVDALIGLIAELCCARADAGDMDACRNALDMLRRNVGRKNQSESLIASHRVHECVAGATKNTVLKVLYLRCLGKIFRPAHLDDWEHNVLIIIQREHDEFVQQLGNGNAAQLSAALRHWNNNWKNRILNLISAGPTS